MKILVTGANGFLGSKTVTRLLDDGCEVIATDLRADHIDPRATVILADIFEERDTWYTDLGSPDVCLHMAWRNGFVHNDPSHMSDLSRHFSFLKSLIDAGLPSLAVMGTMHEVGYHEGAIDENTPCAPLSLYGIAKNALREAVLLYAKDKPTAVEWLRAYYIYGTDETGNSIFSKLRRAVAEGKTVFPFTSGKNQYDFIHIDELTRLISASVRQSEVTGIINVCDGNPVSLAEMVERYIRDNNLPIRLDYGKYPDRPYDSPCVYGDRSKLDRILRKV